MLESTRDGLADRVCSTGMCYPSPRSLNGRSSLHDDPGPSFVGYEVRFQDFEGEQTHSLAFRGYSFGVASLCYLATPSSAIS